MEKTATSQQLNDLLKGERAAAETYRQALEKFGADPKSDGLREIQKDHLEAIRSLKDHVVVLGDEPKSSSGAWGVFAKTVMGSAKLFGDRSALKALKEGEEHGLKQYEDVVKENKIDLSARHLVTDRLIPRQRDHITRLDNLLNAVGT